MVMHLRILKGKDAWKLLVELESRNVELSTFKEPVRTIIEQIKLRGDDAVSEFVERLYGVKLSPEEFEISDDLMDEALSIIDRDLDVVEELVDRVREFYSIQRPEDFVVIRKGSEYGVRWIPLERVGIHVPEGEGYSYFSTLIYTAVPAKVAGVPQISVFTPPLAGGYVSPYLLAAAKLSGVTSVYRIGGPAAVAVMAYGTASIQEVQKIFGTGDLLFMAAKKMVSPDVDVDFPSSPVEHVIVAGMGADSEKIAWELASQAEHGMGSLLIAITVDEEVAERTVELVKGILNDLSMPAIDEASILVLDSWEDVKEAIDVISPARVLIIGESEEELVFRNAGATIWNAPSPLVDYALGVPQRLPSSGHSRFRGPLTLYDFMKSILTVRGSEDLLKELGDLAVRVARMEGMEFHARYIERIIESIPR